MELNNGTSDPVDYEQQGSGPQQDEPVKGRLSPAGTPGSSVDCPPSGLPPFRVVFKFPPGQKIPDREAEARDIPRDDSVVTLCADWTTAVDKKCGA